MKKEEYFDLKSKFCAIEEKIYLFDSGEHDEYDYDSLCDELDRVHEELCFAVSKLSQKLYVKTPK